MAQYVGLIAVEAERVRPDLKDDDRMKVTYTNGDTEFMFKNQFDDLFTEFDGNRTYMLSPMPNGNVKIVDVTNSLPLAPADGCDTVMED